MRFEVPQFIEVEDKIVGPLTWRQFVYLAGGVGIAAVTFLTLPIFLFALIGLPIGGMAFALAFYPVNNRPFSVFLESIFRFANSSKVYHWKRKNNVVYRNTPLTPESKQTFSKDNMGSGINSLSRKLELNAMQKDI